MFNKHPGGKGDRPILPKDTEQFDNNWDTIFKKKKEEEKPTDTEPTFKAGSFDDFKRAMGYK